MSEAAAYLFYNDAQSVMQRVPVGEQPVTIGDRDLCTLTLGGAEVGPIHAAIERAGDGCRVRRLSRVRPMQVDGSDVESQQLANGAQIDLNGTELTYVEAPDIAPTMLRFVLAREEDEIRVDLPVAGTITVIGRVEGDILIDDDSVSSSHLEIENFGNGLCWARDLGSTNGSSLNEVALTDRRQPLADGDILKVGRVVIEVTDGGPPSDDLKTVVQRTVIFVPDSAKA